MRAGRIWRPPANVERRNRRKGILHHDKNSARTRFRDGNNSIPDFAALDPHHSRRSHHVHDRVYRSHKHIPRLAEDEPGPAFGSATSRNGRGHFLLGLPGVANSRRASGQTLDPEEIYQRSVGRLGNLCGWLRSCPHVSRTAAAPVAPWRGGKRRFFGHLDFIVALVLPLGTRARQRYLAALFAGSRNPLLAFLGMDFGPLELARDAGRRGLAPVPMAGNLARVRPGPSAGGIMAARE